MQVNLEEVGPTFKEVSRLLGEKDSNGNLTNKLKNGQHFIIQLSLKYKEPAHLFIENEKLALEALP